MHIVAYPLLHKRCEECGSKTEDEAHEPENVDTDIRRVWTKSRVWWRESGWDGNLWCDRGDLFGYLSEQCDVLLLVVDHLLCRVDLKVVGAIGKKGSEGSGE